MATTDQDTCAICQEPIAERTDKMTVNGVVHHMACWDKRTRHEAADRKGKR